MMVVGRAVGAGLVVLILWLAVSWIIKSTKPSTLDPISSTPSTIDQSSNSQTSTPTNPSAPPAVAFGTEIANPQPATPRPQATKPKKATAEKTSADPAMSDTPGDQSAQNTDPPKPAPKRSPSTKQPMPDEEPMVQTSDSMAASPLVRAVKDSLYAVIVQEPSESKQVQVGTAWASSRRFLVTSATVVAAIEEHQQQGMVASVVHVTSGKSIRIKNVRIHDSYRKAVEGVEDAREQRDASKLVSERAAQVRYDLGVLDIGRNEKLPMKISTQTDPLDESKDTMFAIIGLPFKPTDVSDELTFDENTIKERRSRKPSSGTAPQNKDMELTIQFVPDSNGRNWTGSPVLNKKFEVIGVVSQLPAINTGGKPIKPEFGIAWIGRLHEFAADAE
jgi:hypothetical protein